MAVREFTDSQGVEWRVWDVTPSHMHPATRTEDYMGNLQDGWLVFESDADKRRLEAPYPAEWTSYPLPQLEALCRRAVPVVRRAARSPSGEFRAMAVAETERKAIDASGAHRTFLSPRGREWTVRVHECMDRDGTHRVVLRFTAGDTVVELTHWPDDWSSATVAQYGLMLLDAEPPRRLAQGGPQRRREDRPADATDASLRA